MTVMRVGCCSVILIGTILLFSASPAFSECVHGDCNEGTQNFAGDIKCYRTAAILGDASAQNTLGYIYAEGRGVDPDLSEAYAWWGVAAMNGIDVARAQMRSTRQKLSPAQFEEAQTLAMEYFMLSNKYITRQE